MILLGVLSDIYVQLLKDNPQADYEELARRAIVMTTALGKELVRYADEQGVDALPVIEGNETLN